MGVCISSTILIYLKIILDETELPPSVAYLTFKKEWEVDH